MLCWPLVGSHGCIGLEQVSGAGQYFDAKARGCMCRQQAVRVDCFGDGHRVKNKRVGVSKPHLQQLVVSVDSTDTTMLGSPCAV